MAAGDTKGREARWMKGWSRKRGRKVEDSGRQKDGDREEAPDRKEETRSQSEKWEKGGWIDS